MGNIEKIMEKLEQELAQARKRIAELETAAATSGKISSLYHSIFENFVESATDSFSMWDSNLNLSYINNATLQYHPAGTKKSDIIGKNIKEMIPHAEKSGRYEKYKHVLETGEPLILEDFKADPKYGDTYLSIKVFKISDGIGIVSSDITERKRVEQALQDKKQRLTALIDNAPDIIFSYDVSGRFTSGNKRAEELIGYSREELLGKTFTESGIFTPESLAKASKRLAENREGKQTQPIPFELIAKDGSRIFVEVHSVPIVQGDKMEVIAIARDITERKRTEDALRQSEEKLRAIFESIGDSITVVDVNGNITDLNDAAVKLFGCKSKEEVLGMSGLTFIVEENRPPVIEALPVRCVQYRFRRMDGSTFWGETNSDVLYDKSGNITGFIGIIRDITERKEADEALRRSEERLRTYFENAPDAIFVYDFNGVFLDGNRMGEEITGYRKTELVGRNFIESGLFTEQYALKAMNAVLKDLKGETSGPEEYEITRKDGQKRVLESTSFVVKGQWKGEVVGIARDVTERKKMEEALRQSEEKLRAILESISDSITVIDTNGNIADLNDAAVKLFGCKSRDEALGMNSLTFMAEDSQPSATVKLNAAKTERLVQYKFKRMDGSTFWGETSTDAIHNSSGEITGFVAIIMDITERKELEDKLQQSEEKIRQVFNSVGVGITVTDMEGKIVEMNDVGLHLCGYDKDELLGRDGISIIAERDRPRIVEAMINTFKTGQSETNEFIALKADGTEYEVEAIATVTRDYSGTPEGLIISITDITGRKRIERELSNYKANLESMVHKRTTELEKTYQELQESEERLRAFFENVPDIIFAHNMQGQFTEINKKAIEISGYSRDEIIGKNILDTGILPPDQIEGVIAGIKGIEEGESGYPYEVQLMKKNGDRITVEAVSFPIKRKGELEVMGIARDITERKRMENSLRNSEEKLRTMFASMADGVVVTDLEGKFKDANESLLCMFGYSSKEAVMGMNGFDFIAEKDRDLAIGDMTQLFSEGLVTGRSWTFKHSSGSEFQAELSTALLKDSKGNPAEILVVIRDITERKRMEETLRESEAKLRIMFASMADGVVVTSMDGKIRDLNEAQLHLFGYDRKEDAMGENGFDFIVDKDRDSAIKEMSTLLRDGVTEERSYRFTSRKGREFIAEISSSLLCDYSGNPTDIMCVVRDITDRKRMEEALRESEAKLRAIYDSIGDGITVTDLKGTILDQNEAGLRLSGYSKRGDVVGRNGLTFISEADRDRARNDMLNVLQKGIGITTEYKLVNKHGKEFDAEVSGAMITDGTGKPAAIVNVIRNITERKHIEEALRESEAKYRTLVEQSEQGICIFQDGRISFANNALSKINGYSLKEMYAMAPDELLMTVYPEDRETFVDRIKSKLQGSKLPSKYEYRTIRKDGTERHLETFAKRIIYKGQPAIQSTIADITERKQWEAKLKESKDELRFYLNQITKAQEEERKRIARELHDDTIQELIALSRQLDDLIDKDIKPDEDRRSSRKKVAASRQKVDMILQGVRRFTRDLRPSVLDDLGLVPALEWLTSDMSNRFEIPINISIVGAERPATPEVALAMFRIAQESLRNAGQHSKASQIQVNLKNSNKTATLSIIDNGVGFTAPKQTTSLTRVGKLGIAGMHERAQLIGATLSIKSKRNKGTAVTLEVPIK